MSKVFVIIDGATCLFVNEYSEILWYNYRHLTVYNFKKEEREEHRKIYMLHKSSAQTSISSIKSDLRNLSMLVLSSKNEFSMR